MGDFKIQYNSIFVIESLHHERKTGTELYNDIISKYELKTNGFITRLISVKNRNELISELTKIQNLVIYKKIKPIIHIECHGDENGKGIFLDPSNELVEYREIINVLRVINIKLRNSLIVSLGVCSGMTLLYSIDFNKPCPFFALITSNGIVSNKKVIEAYSIFYKSLLFENDLIYAIRQIKKVDKFKLYGPERIFEIFERGFVQLMSDELRKELIKENKLKDIESFDMNKLQTFISPQHNNGHISILNSVKNEILDLRRMFLMIDKFPDIKDRFKNN